MCTGYKTNPAQPAFSELCVHLGEAGVYEDLDVATLPRKRGTQRMWKLLSFQSCLAYIVHVSLSDESTDFAGVVGFVSFGFFPDTSGKPA